MGDPCLLGDSLQESEVEQLNVVVEAILARQSVRSGYIERPIPPATLETILACGLRAPSSKGAAPWRFHVVVAREQLSAIADLVLAAPGRDAYVPADPRTGLPRTSDYASTVAESAEILRSVSAAIFIENRGKFSVSRREVARASDESRENVLLGFGLEAIGLGAAVENMWIAAVSFGLAGVFMGDVLIAEERIRNLLACEGDLAGALALGYSDDRRQMSDTRADDLAIYYDDAGHIRGDVDEH